MVRPLLRKASEQGNHIFFINLDRHRTHNRIDGNDDAAVCLSTQQNSLGPGQGTVCHSYTLADIQIWMMFRPDSLHERIAECLNIGTRQSCGLSVEGHKAYY